MKENILVTGGLGFLGSHLVEELLKTPCDITIVDSRINSAVDPIIYSPNCQIVISDIANYHPEGKKFTQIYHLADIAGPARILGFAGELAKRSILGLHNVLKLCEPNYTKLLLVSSSEIYGRAGQYREDSNIIVYFPYTVRLEYAVAKTLCEVTALNFAAAKNIIVNIVRPFNIAGPRQSSQGGFVVPRFFEAALTNKPITVFGEGSQIRTFTHVLDTVSSLMTIMSSSLNKMIFNSGNPNNKIQIKDLAVKVKDICTSNSEIIYIDPTELYGSLYAESFDKTPDISSIQNSLGWYPQRNLNDILVDVLEFYRRQETPDIRY